MEQSAVDANCTADDFMRNENVIARSVQNPRARKYLKLPLPCNLISYGTNIVASVEMQYRQIVERYIGAYSVEHCFETPNIHVLDEAFAEHGMQTCFMAEYFLPDVNVLRPLNCGYDMKVLTSKDFEALYLPQWANALCKERKELDVLGIGAFHGDKLIGLAGCSADCETMLQIGVDVLPEYRRQGVASALTSNLAVEVLNMGKVPFYCCAWSNIKSARNAVKSGFRPAWAELTVKPKEFVREMNKAE